MTTANTTTAAKLQPGQEINCPGCTARIRIESKKPVDWLDHAAWCYRCGGNATPIRTERVAS